MSPDFHHWDKLMKFCPLPKFLAGYATLTPSHKFSIGSTPSLYKVVHNVRKNFWPGQGSFFHGCTPSVNPPRAVCTKDCVDVYPSSAYTTWINLACCNFLFQPTHHHFRLVKIYSHSLSFKRASFPSQNLSLKSFKVSPNKTKSSARKISLIKPPSLSQSLHQPQSQTAVVTTLILDVANTNIY